MRFLLDQDVWRVTENFLKDLKHDVLSVSEIGFSQSSDFDLLKIAQEQKRIFVTRDRDFGNLVFVKNLGSGVIYLRISPSTINSVHKEIELILKKYEEKDLRNAFITVEAGRYRFRKISKMD